MNAFFTRHASSLKKVSISKSLFDGTTYFPLYAMLSSCPYITELIIGEIDDLEMLAAWRHRDIEVVWNL